MNKHDRRFAERTREAFQEGSAAADESTRAMGNGYFAAAEALRDFNMKLIDGPNLHDGNAQLCAASRDCERAPRGRCSLVLLRSSEL
jgi:hypothetical protein